MNLDEFGAALLKLGNEGVRQAAVGTATAVSNQVVREAKLNLSGRVLRVGSGRLRASAQGSVDVSGDRVTAVARVGGGGVGEVPYASIHEHGGVIRPKRGRFLAIPMGPALKGGKNGGAGMWPRDIPGLTFIPIKGGAQGMLVKRMGRGKSASWVPWFHLVRSVRMPKRPYLAPAVDAVVPTIPATMADQLRARLGALR